ncbi:MAG TPA: hypothetical protein VGG28_02365 [Kofleriaceae bacterium]
MRSCLLVAAIVMLSACDSGTSTSAAPKGSAAERKLAGVYPDKFKCETILSDDAVGQLLGGSAHPVDSAMAPPKGIAYPCNYQVTSDTGTEYWTYDFDCRDGMKQRADALFAQYRSGSTDMVDQYNALADAGQVKPDKDAGVVYHAPAAAVEVDVGAKGLDHHGQGLIFIDDDAPCYVRVVGPDAQHRLTLARAIAKNLTFANAPMTPRPFP